MTGPPVVVVETTLVRDDVGFFVAMPLVPAVADESDVPSLPPLCEAELVDSAVLV